MEPSQKDSGASLPELLTAEEVITYLRLDTKGGDPMERLRSLIRRQQLPRLGRGHVIRFRRSEIDAWLAGERIVRRQRIHSPARLGSGIGVKAARSPGAQ